MLRLFLIFFIAFFSMNPLNSEDVNDNYKKEYDSVNKMPFCHMFAVRKVLNDLNETEQFLSNEILYFVRDVNALYNSWNSYGENTYRSFSNSSSYSEVIKRSDLEYYRNEIWKLYSETQKLRKKMYAKSKYLKKLENEWWYLRHKMEKSSDRGKIEKYIKDIIKLKNEIQKLSESFNNIDYKISHLQEDLDYIRGRYLGYINSIYSKIERNNSSIDLPEPWHWVYRKSNTPRPDMQYNFSSSYDKYIHYIHEELHI